MSLFTTAPIQFQSERQGVRSHDRQQAPGALIQQPAPDKYTLSSPPAVADGLPAALADESDETSGTSNRDSQVRSWREEESPHGYSLSQSSTFGHPYGMRNSAGSTKSEHNHVHDSLQEPRFRNLDADASKNIRQLFESISPPPWHESPLEEGKNCTQRTARALRVSHSFAEQVEGSSCSANKNGGETLETACLRKLLFDAEKALSTLCQDEKEQSKQHSDYTQRTAQALGVSHLSAEQVEGSSCPSRSDGGEALQSTCPIDLLHERLSSYRPEEFTSAPPKGFRLEYNLAEILPTMICTSVE